MSNTISLPSPRSEADPPTGRRAADSALHVRSNRAAMPVRATTGFRIKKSDGDVNPAMLRILRALEKRPNSSVLEISNDARVGMSTLACRGSIRTLKHLKLIFISGWRKRNGRFCIPLFSRGSEDDAPRPAAS